MAATSSHLRNAVKRKPDVWHEVFIFLFAADLVVLFIYLLLLPSWEMYNTRLRAIGSLAATVATYFGLNRVVKKHFSEVFDSSALRAALLFVTVILWATVLPVWKHRFVFVPPQDRFPTITIGGRSRYLVDSGRRTSKGQPIAELDGLLLRDYEYNVAGSPEKYFLPAIDILKGSFLNRTVELQLPCALELPFVHGATVYYRRYPWDKEVQYGLLPDNGQVYLMQGHYDYVSIVTDTEEGSAALEMTCPRTEKIIDMHPKGK